MISYALIGVLNVLRHTLNWIWSWSHSEFLLPIYINSMEQSLRS